MPDPSLSPRRAEWREKLYTIIFEHDTRTGQAFDVALIIVILLSVLAVMIESVPTYHARYLYTLRGLEWGFTIVFTMEYVLRLLCACDVRRYATSFFGLVDLIAVLPTYASLFIPGAQYFLVIRTLRLIRIFRVLKLAHYLIEADVLARALRASRRKITVFLVAVLSLVTVFGSLLYVVEGEASGFSSIPRSVYWAIVTLTTVGYGDIAPVTGLGQFLAALIMITGYAIIAVPTGIVTVELANAARNPAESADVQVRQACPACGLSSYEADAVFCRRCGTRLPGTFP